MPTLDTMISTARALTPPIAPVVMHSPRCRREHPECECNTCGKDFYSNMPCCTWAKEPRCPVAGCLLWVKED